MTVSRSAVPKKILEMFFSKLGLDRVRATDVTVYGSGVSMYT